MFVGPPACGKSTYARNVAENSVGRCVRINQDTLKTRPACLKAAREALSAGKSVVIDNTNAKKAQRAEWLSLASSLSSPGHNIVSDASPPSNFLELT